MTLNDVGRSIDEIRLQGHDLFITGRKSIQIELLIDILDVAAKLGNRLVNRDIVDCEAIPLIIVSGIVIPNASHVS